MLLGFQLQVIDLAEDGVRKGSSHVNTWEANRVLKRCATARDKGFDTPTVICLYAAQRDLLRKLFLESGFRRRSCQDGGCFPGPYQRLGDTLHYSGECDKVRNKSE